VTERRYLKTEKVAHLVDASTVWTSYRWAVCGVDPVYHDPDGWLGTGSQEEYELAAELPLCRRCERQAKGL
jgi:hypothetical protein